MSASPELHVIFGTGPLGISVMQALAAEGKRIRMINRSGRAPALAAVPAGVEFVAGDAYNASDNIARTTGATHIYQCAQPAYSEWTEKFPPFQAAIMDAAAAHGARLILGENLYMYGDTGGQPIHEGLPYQTHTRKGKVRGEMAETALAAHRAGRVRVVIGRAASFYGPGVRASTVGERLFAPAVQGGRAEIFGDPDVPRTVAYIDDFGRALALLGGAEDAFGQAWIVPHAPPITARQFVGMVFAEAGTPMQIRVVNRLMLRLFGLFNPYAREVVEMMYEVEQPYRVDAGRFTARFGDFATPQREGIARTVAWYRQWLARQQAA
jgi:nucleoside-diphosphate-sugar epimerase